jgi:hypothetical protein
MLLEFIFSCLPSTMQQYQDLKFIPFKIKNLNRKPPITVAQKTHQFPQNFIAPDDARVDGNMECSDKF